MKSIAFFALTALASTAFAAGPSNMVLNGPSTQKTYQANTNVYNVSNADTQAVQNVSSNTAGVSITAGGVSNQTSNLTNSTVPNYANQKDALARQNLASNNGEVTINAKSDQTVYAKNAYVENKADGTDAKAVQNIASNYGNVTVNQHSIQYASLTGNSGTVNKALGHNAYAVQNISSNDACAEDPCPGGRCK